MQITPQEAFNMVKMWPGIMIDNELKKMTELLPNGVKHRLCGALISSV